MFWKAGAATTFQGAFLRNFLDQQRMGVGEKIEDAEWETDRGKIRLWQYLQGSHEIYPK